MIWVISLSYDHLILAILSSDQLDKRKLDHMNIWALIIWSYQLFIDLLFNNRFFVVTGHLITSGYMISWKPNLLRTSTLYSLYGRLTTITYFHVLPGYLPLILGPHTPLKHAVLQLLIALQPASCKQVLFFVFEIKCLCKGAESGIGVVIRIRIRIWL